MFSKRRDIVCILQDFRYIAGISWFMLGDTINHLGGYHNSGVGLSSVDQGMFSASDASIYKMNVFCQ